MEHPKDDIIEEEIIIKKKAKEEDVSEEYSQDITIKQTKTVIEEYVLLESPDVTTEHSINLTDQPVQKAEEKDEKITLKRKPSKKLESIEIEKINLQPEVEQVISLKKKPLSSEKGDSEIEFTVKQTTLQEEQKPLELQDEKLTIVIPRKTSIKEEIEESPFESQTIILEKPLEISKEEESEVKIKRKKSKPLISEETFIKQSEEVPVNLDQDRIIEENVVIIEQPKGEEQIEEQKITIKKKAKEINISQEFKEDITIKQTKTVIEEYVYLESPDITTTAEYTISQPKHSPKLGEEIDEEINTFKIKPHKKSEKMESIEVEKIIVKQEEQKPLNTMEETFTISGKPRKSIPEIESPTELETIKLDTSPKISEDEICEVKIKKKKPLTKVTEDIKEATVIIKREEEIELTKPDESIEGELITQD